MLPLLALTYTATRLGLEAQSTAAFRLLRLGAGITKSAYQIVPGSSGGVAVYSHHMHHLAVMRKVLMRMKSWMNYVFGLGH